jgi:hypothetical protein
MGLDELRRRRSLRLTAIALAWSLALIVGAFWAPLYHGEHAGSTAAGVIHTSATLVHANGIWVLGLVSVPAAVSLIVLVALARRGRSRAAALIAGVAVALLVAFNALTLFTIGIFIVPTSALLARAVWATPAMPHRRAAAV